MTISALRGVFLTGDDAAYLADALRLLGRLMAEQRSQPSPRLSALTTKLHRTVDSLAVTDSTRDHRQRGETSVQPLAFGMGVRALQRDSLHGGRHELGTGEAARTLGLTPGGVRDLARRGRLPARHTGTRWVYPADAVHAEAENRAVRRGG